MKLRDILPKYAWIPVLCVIIVNFAVYSLTEIFVDDSLRHYLDTAIDSKIPFVPFFVLFYVLCYPVWLLNWILVGREEKTLCYRFCKADLIAKLLCLVCFIVYPTIIERPSLIVNDFFTWGLNMIYTIDKPVNCLPSIHIIANWMALRASFMMKRPPKIWRIICIVMMVFCALSIVLIKQHYLIDIPTGILAAEIGLAISKRLNNERFLWNS